MKMIYGILLALTMCNCNNKSNFQSQDTTKEIFYGIEDTLVSRLIIDSIFMDDYPKVTYCMIDYYFDTAKIIFFYQDNDYSPWTNEMITRTNRFLLIENHKIPIIFESDFTFVVRDSAMMEKSSKYSYNLFNIAELVLFQNEKLIEYKNHYADGGSEVSEKMRKEYNQ
jgi:hypothetical protein